MNVQKLILSTLLCVTLLVSAETTHTYIKAKDICLLDGWEEYTGDEQLLNPAVHKYISRNYHFHVPPVLLDPNGELFVDCCDCTAKMRALFNVSPEAKYLHEKMERTGSTLHLHDTALTSLVGIAELDAAKYARKAHLQRNELRDITALFAIAPQLKKLWLSDNKLTTLPVGLVLFSNLKKLCLDTNMLTSIAGLEKLTLLENKLCLRGNQLSALPELAQLPLLKSIDVRDNRLTTFEQSWLHADSELREIMVDDGVLLPTAWLTTEARNPHDVLPKVVRITSGKIFVYKMAPGALELSRDAVFEHNARESGMAC